ncbi:MAG: DUF1415 family protein, partial [Phycisphaerae bacterium]|nr:DUF1415 family protein [Phycisphaerae bacterium]
MDSRAVIADTRRWLERAVIGLNLCPFTKAVLTREQVRFVASTAATPEALALELAAELQRLADALQQHRLVTLHGPGGVGKTRLALTAAARAPRPDGTWLLRLDALADGAALRPSVARLLGLAAGSDADDATLARALRPLQALLVLDNAEHLDGLGALAAALRDAAPSLAVLVTSRRPLGVAGESLLALDGLALPDEHSRDAEAAQAFD